MEHPVITEILRTPQLCTELERRHVSDALAALAGVRRVQINLADHTVRLERDERLGLDVILRALRDAGFTEIVVLV